MNYSLAWAEFIKFSTTELAPTNALGLKQSLHEKFTNLAHA